MNKIFILALSLLCFFVYFNSLNNDFVLDDEPLIVNNSIIKSIKLLPLIFRKSLYDYPGIDLEISFDKMYRPLQLLTYSIEYRIWKLKPLGFHLTNVLIHLFNAVLIYYLLLDISNNIIAKISSILFVVHPIHTSVVSYIAGRADLLSSLFMLSSIIGFLKFVKLKLKVYYILSLLFAFLALISRENALLLFLFILLILYTIKAKPDTYLFVIPFIVLDLLYISLRLLLFGSEALSIHPVYLTMPLRIVNFFNIIPRYLSILILPKDLHLLRATPFIRDLFSQKAFFAIIFILFYVALIIRYKQNRLLVFSMLWFLIGIIPVFIYMDGYTLLKEALMAESWLYISSIGFFVIFASYLSKLTTFGWLLFACFVSFYGFLVVANNNYWKNNIILYRNILEYTPQDPIRGDLINLYFRYGCYRDALAEIKKFSVYYPDTPRLYLHWGDYYFLIGQTNKAIDSYNKALNKDKYFSIGYYNLGICYLRLKQLDMAKDSFLRCLKINPRNLLNLVRLADTYMQIGNHSEAIKYYQMALALDPENLLVKGKIKNAE